MKKLLETYRANPVLKNAQAIRAYDRKHPMASCLFSVADQDAIADAVHHANKGTERDVRGFVS